MYIVKARSGIYHVRIRVPADAQPLLRRTELHCSLGTRSRREAEQRARPIITRVRAQIFKAKAKSSGDQYRADILRARADSLGAFDTIDRHFEEQHPQHTLEQLKQFMAQLSAPTETPPSEPARTVLTAFSDLTPLTTIIDHNETADLGKAAISQRRRAFDGLMHHLHAEGIYYLEHTTPDNWQAWCRSLYSDGLSHSTITQRQSSARKVISDYLVQHGRTFNAHEWTSVKLGHTPRAELEARRDANGPLTIQRWQEIYDNMLRHKFPDEADVWALGLLRPRLSSEFYAFARRGDEEHTERHWSNKCRKARQKAGAFNKIETQHSTRSTFRTLAPRMSPASTPAGVIEAIMGHEISGGVASATKHYLRAFEPDAHAFMAHWRPAISIRQSRA